MIVQWWANYLDMNKKYTSSFDFTKAKNFNFT